MTHTHVLHNSCQWLGWLYTAHAACAFLWSGWNVSPNVSECLRASRAPVLCSQTHFPPLLIHNEQNAGTRFLRNCWVLQSCYMIGRDSLIGEGGLELLVTPPPPPSANTQRLYWFWICFVSPLAECMHNLPLFMSWAKAYSIYVFLVYLYCILEEVWF